MVMGKILDNAKELTGYDTEYMYKIKSKIPMLCPFCHSRLEVIPNLDYMMQKRKGDMYYTYDDICLVSERFKLFCDSNKYLNLKFIKLKKCNWYYFRPTGIFETDIYKNDLGLRCPYCNNYTDVCGGVYKAKRFEILSDDFILSTDTFYGSSETKAPTIIIGLKTMKKMNEYGLKGLCFSNVYECVE